MDEEQPDDERVDPLLKMTVVMVALLALGWMATWFLPPGFLPWW